MKRYMIVKMIDGGLEIVDTGVTPPRELGAGEVADLLNASAEPAPSPQGVVWRKPGEPGRVTRHDYLVIENGRRCAYTWDKTWDYDGWRVPGVTHWAEIPPPPEEGT